jgi:hypothetical protein
MKIKNVKIIQGIGGVYLDKVKNKEKDTITNIISKNIIKVMCSLVKLSVLYILYY